MNKLLPASAVFALATALVSACASTSGPSASSVRDSGGAGGIETFKPADRKVLPALSGTTLSGTALDTTSLKGRVTVLNIWGSWCEPCKRETPDLEHAYEADKAAGVAFVGIDTHDDAGKARAFVADQHITYPNLIDGNDAALVTRLAGIVPLQAVPATLIIDKNGSIAWRALRGVDYPTLSAALAQITAEQ
jgi:thiol-disulfide isomerase/thioredoxin